MFFFLGLKDSFAQSSGTIPLDDFEGWTKKRVREKVYIHTDRTVYAKGDTIWFNAYTVTGSGNRLSRLSGALYVELFTQSGKISQVKIPIVNGLAKGCFPTDLTLIDGDYSIRAYTRLMRNDPTSFFQKNIYIGSAKAAQIVSAVIASSSTENGSNKIELKYTNRGGEPIADRSFKYSITEGADTLKTGKSATDGNGNLSLHFKSTSHLKFVSVEAEADDEKVNTVVAINQPSDFDIQILAEGGTFVEGLQSRLAVKCVGPDGYGKNITGKIVDDQGVTVTTFNCDHYGMGQFLIVPEAGRTYTAIADIKDGFSTKVNLPAASRNGAIFSAYTNSSDTITLRIQASSSVHALKSVWHLTGVAGNELVIKKDFTLNGPLLSFKIPCSDLPTGITQLTLFSDRYEPVAERLVFNYPKVNSSIKLSNLKESFKPREMVDLGMQSEVGNQAVVGSYAVSVTDERLQTGSEDDEQTILSSLLLSSDVKGYIEHPNYYFHDINDKKKAELDLLLRSQGYRSFSWKNLNNKQEPLYSPEALETVFSGSAKTLFGKAYAGADITILSLKAKLFQQTKTDQSGRFSFPPFLLTDSVKITFKASAPDKKRRLAVEIDSIPGYHPLTDESYDYLLHHSVGAYHYNDIFNSQKELQEKAGNHTGIQLKDVVVKSKQQMSRSANYNGAGRADQVVVGDQLKSCANLSICLAGLISGVIFKSVQTDFGVVMAPFLARGGPDARPMLLYWNGMQVELQDYPVYLDQNIENPQDIESIEILRNDNYTTMYGAQSRGVIVVTTRGGSLSGGRLNLSTRLFEPVGFSKVKDFYVPKYNTLSKGQKPDFRSTVYWNPSVVTSATGNVPIKYYNSDATGNFRITIEGITPDGNMLHSVYRYKVTK
ncbi:hypothetical protein ACFSR6_07920 [Pedobacter vanadiisoli]|uniref:TonB-dependent receptor-like protein n=1 Tax=Pedobacter vanadiisoli TaxID=1761975 RepID=A0ABW5MI46_9SPHI